MRRCRNWLRRRFGPAGYSSEDGLPFFTPMSEPGSVAIEGFAEEGQCQFLCRGLHFRIQRNAACSSPVSEHAVRSALENHQRLTLVGHGVEQFDSVGGVGMITWDANHVVGGGDMQGRNGNPAQ